MIGDDAAQHNIQMLRQELTGAARTGKRQQIFKRIFAADTRENAARNDPEVTPERMKKEKCIIEICQLQEQTGDVTSQGQCEK